MKLLMGEGPRRPTYEQSHSAQATRRWVPSLRVLGVFLRAVRGANDRRALIGGLCAARLRFLRSLDTWPDFGRGWARRVAAVRALALAMESH